MGFLAKVFGIRPAQPGDDTEADRQIRAAVAEAVIAQDRLRENIRHDPAFAGKICQALGCAHPSCQDPLAAISRRVNQIPRVFARVVAGQGRVLPFQPD
jgi:hypothetical protein